MDDLYFSLLRQCGFLQDKTSNHVVWPVYQSQFALIIQLSATHSPKQLTSAQRSNSLHPLY